MLENWQHNEPVSLFVDDGTEEQEYRLTFKMLNAVEQAKFRVLYRKAVQFIVTKYGDAEDRDEEQQIEAAALMDILWFYAIGMSALAKVELRTGDEWQSAELPETRRNMETFAYRVPAGIPEFFAQAAVNAGNPWRVFGGASNLTDDEKKGFRLIVSPSEN